MDDLTFFLTAPFFFAEIHIQSQLGQLTESQKNAITNRRDTAIEVYLKYLTRPDGTIKLNEISPGLSMGVWWLYQTSWPEQYLKSKRIYRIPPGTSVDWLTLISGFIEVKKNFISEGEVKDSFYDINMLAIRIQFTEALLAHADAGCFYDKDIACKVFNEGLGTSIITGAAEMRLASHFNRYDKVEEKEAINELRQAIADLDFAIELGNLTGQYGHRKIKSEDRIEMSEGLKKILSLYQKKEVQLVNRTKKPTANKPIQLSLTNRQRILLYCYQEGAPIQRGHKDYNDYILFATRQKRLAYPNDSLNKLKPLIKDIEKVISYLEGEHRQLADRELATLRSRI